jgi:putative hemolysin
MAELTIVAAVFLDHLFRILLLIALICCSGFFSGSETAFFHLSRKTVRQFSRSKVRLEKLVFRILQDPNRFLTALLFGNMAVNVLFFAVSSTLLISLSQQYGHVYATVSGISCFMGILLFGEMLPKSIAYANAKRFSLLASPACFFMLTVLRPLLRIIDLLVVQSTIRLFVHPQNIRSISKKQLNALMDSSRRQGLINNDESQLLTEILKFSHLKVRHVMLPRVEMPACPIDYSAEQMRDIMLEKKISKIPVYTQGIDRVVGMIHLRDLVLDPDRPPDTMLHQVHFVPEQKTIESLIEFFRQSSTEDAIVVDEYGGVAGFVDLEDITERLLGPMEESISEKPIEQVGPLQYRLHANLSISDWVDAFGIDIDEGRVTTIGGFMTALLEKIPRQGDSVVFGNMRFSAEKVLNNRIQTILLSVEPFIDSNEERKQE